MAENSDIHPGQQSTWRSFTRVASDEVDFLNVEIVMLGRLHGIAAPYNGTVQHIAGQLAQREDFSNPLPLEGILSLVSSSRWRGVELAVAR
ncbi:hypothetical protein [Rhizobium sp. Rhizsp42]|uniref:hypothetical protein n=1 Tax=Rhizobium sp. Rhizsp42 TaxID=3243034 RepID=UPI000DB9C7E8